MLVVLVALSMFAVPPLGAARDGSPVPVGIPPTASSEPSPTEWKPLAATTDTAIPEYPSSGSPAPLGRLGPVPLLANAVQHHHFDDAWALGYRGAGVRVAVVDEGVDFGHLDLQGTQAVIPSGPYAGWPIAYDPKSLTTYLRTGFPDGTYFANTTQTGLGPFEVTHTIRVDGTNDFGDREKWAVDPRDNAAGGPGGDKQDFDLTDLYVTRDASNWYVGFPVYLRTQNASFVLLIDVDNATSGAYGSPFGSVDTNASHADRVNDVAWSPDGTKVATVAGDRLVRIWDRSGALVRTMPGHLGEPLSVAWSPDGTKVASADKDRLRLWDAATGSLIREIQYVPFGDPTITENGILAFSPNGTWVAAGTFKFVHVFDVATGAKFGSVWPANTDVNAVSFNPVGDRMAVALGDNTVRVYAVTPLIFNTPIPATALYTLSSHTQPAVKVAWSPDGTKVVSGARDNTAKLWDVATQAVLRTMTDQMSWVLAADWNAAGTQFVTSSRGLSPSVNPSFAIYDSTGILVRLVPQSKALAGVDWSSLGEIATAGEDLTGRMWTLAGDPLRILIAHRPDFALVVHGFSRYSDRESKYVHGTELATWYRWDVGLGSWVAAPLANVSGSQAAFQFGDTLFNEFQVPRSLIGDPPAISMEVFSAGETGTRPQDTVPSDKNVDFRNLDLTPGIASLSAFAWRRVQEYQVSPSLTSVSGAFHFGFHPGPTVQRRFGALGVLVVDSTVAADYDRVVLDMNDDKVFDPTDVTVSKANPIAALDNYDAASGGPGPDGYPDVSAGMIYFISDGARPIPYSDRLAARKGSEGVQVRIPAAGDLVAFAGEFGIDPITTAKSEHGTRIASAIVAQGRLPTPLAGTASAAKLVTIVNGLSDVIESWTFAVEGPDGQPNTGDEAQVVVSAFNFPTVHHDGWDTFSRTADYLSTQVGGNLVTFVASAGDAGYGYGTVLSPASGPSVIAAGRAGDFSLNSLPFGGSEGPNPHFRDPAIPGSRGPTPQGFVKPELLAVDTANLAIPLHAAADGSSAVSSAPLTGSDVSAAIVAGAVVIVHGAFTARHARPPTVDEVRSLLMSGADDTGHDVLTQGAGFLNVSRSVRLAAETADAGLEVSPSMWHPGSYRGSPHRAFTRLVFPGDPAALPMTLRNRGSSPITAGLEAVAYTKIGEYVHANVTRRDAYQPDGNLALWVNDTGVWKVDAATFAAVRVAPPIPGLWSNAELVKVTAYSDLGRIEYKIGTTFYVNYSYTLRAYDWTINWAHWGGIGPFPAPAFYVDELNPIAATFHQANVLEVRAAFPGSALQEGLVISLEAVSATLAVEGLPWTFLIEFYDRTPWPWASGLPPSVIVPAGGAQTVTATLTVPPTAPLGSYEAAILVRDPTRGTTTVPILANVGARGPSLRFGGNLLSTDLYDNHRLFGGYDRALSGGTSGTRLLRPTLGDWRFFFLDIPDQGQWTSPAGYKVLVRSAWATAPSDVDTFAFGRTLADLATQANTSWYGPFTLKQSGKGEELDKPEFRTATQGPEEVIAYDLASGLNVLAFRGFAMRGLEAEVRVSGEAGWVNAPTAVDVATRSLAGREPFAFLSNLGLPGLRASAVGPAQTTAFSELEIRQDVQSWWNFPGWGEWMFRGSFTFEFFVDKALILEVAIQGKADVEDLDMAVFRDVNDNGLIDPEEYLVIDCAPSGGGLCVPTGPNTWGYNADGDADERVKWVAPPNGRYFVKVLGFTVNADPGHFDLQVSVTLDTGKGYEIPEAPKPAEIVNRTSPLAALARVAMNVTWDFPNDTADDAYGGAILLGLPNAPGVVVVPVVVLVDRSAPTIASFRLNALNGRLNDVDNRTTNDPAPQVVASVEDLERGQLVPTSARISLDGMDLTPTAVVSIQYILRGTKLGLWEGTVTLALPSLSEGPHTVEASIADRAGNVAVGSFTFVEDMTAPPLTLAGGLFVNTTVDTWTIAGTTEPNAFVNVRGTWYAADATGGFSIPTPLLEGTNAIAVLAADWFDTDASGNLVPGNLVRVVQTVVRDIRAPVFDRFVVDPSGTIGAAQTVVSGTAHDPVSDSEDREPGAIALAINGLSVPVLADGTFQVTLDLVEGANPITATMTDPTGNSETRTASVTRDTTAPALDATVRPGLRVTSSTVSVEGTTDAGALVSVNGIAVSAPGGAFRTNVTVSRGSNTIIVQAQDFVGNVAERRFTVTYEPESPVSLGVAVGVLGVGLLIGVVVAFLLVRAGVRIPFLPTRGRGPKEGEAAEDAPKEDAPGESPRTAEPEPTPEDPRIVRLRKAFEEGRISREVYEENLRRIEGGGNG